MDGHMILWLIAVVFLAVGGVLVVASAVICINTKVKKKECTVRVVGTVVDIKCETSSGYSGNIPTTSWFPIFSYEANGKMVTKKSNYGTSKQSFYVGQNVTVFYNQDNINQYYVEEEKNGFLIGVLTGIGIIFMVIGAAVFVGMGKLGL